MLTRRRKGRKLVTSCRSRIAYGGVGECICRSGSEGRRRIRLFRLLDRAMLQDRATSESNYRRFIKRVRESGEVWGLRSDDGWAYCASNEYEDTDVLVFWSDRAYAQRHVQGDWSKHKPTAITLDNFIDNWHSRNA